MATNVIKRVSNKNKYIELPRWLVFVVIGIVVLVGIYVVYSSIASSSSETYTSTVNCRDGECFELARNGTVEEQAFIRTTPYEKCLSGLEYQFVQFPNSEFVCLPN